jgi:hypothetical protein
MVDGPRFPASQRSSVWPLGACIGAAVSVAWVFVQIGNSDLAKL